MNTDRNRRFSANPGCARNTTRLLLLLLLLLRRRSARFFAPRRGELNDGVRGLLKFPAAKARSAPYTARSPRLNDARTVSPGRGLFALYSTRVEDPPPACTRRTVERLAKTE